jgi:hypothetical protein
MTRVAGIRIDTHYFGRLDPDPHQSHTRSLSGSKGVAEGSGRSQWRRGGSKVELLRVCTQVDADSHQSDEESDLDPL